MKVREWMNSEPIITAPETDVSTVAFRMNDGKQRQVMVVDSSGKLLGIVTAHDLIAKHAQVHLPTYFSLLGYSFPWEGRKEEREVEQALAVTAADLMTREPRTIEAESDVDEAATRMFDENISCLPVMNGGNLVGVIDEFDIVRLLVVEDQAPT